MDKIYKTFSEEETFNLAKEMGNSQEPGSVICLSGDLGAGKTVFAKGLCDGLGVCEYISSPTFTIVNEYMGEKYPVYHFDMYRIEDESELIEIGYEEYISSDGVCIIEWPSNVEGALPKKRIDVEIERNLSEGDDYRTITIKEIG